MQDKACIGTFGFWWKKFILPYWSAVKWGMTYYRDTVFMWLENERSFTIGNAIDSKALTKMDLHFTVMYLFTFTNNKGLIWKANFCTNVTIYIH